MAPYNVKFTDTCGEEELERLAKACYLDQEVFLLCFSLADAASLTSLTEKWNDGNWPVENVMNLPTPTPQHPHHYVNHGVPVILVGCKSDKRVISEEEGRQAAEKLGCAAYVECSAREQEGLTEVFETAISEFLKYQKTIEPKIVEVPAPVETAPAPVTEKPKQANAVVGYVELEMVSAEGLPSMDVNGLADPYVLIKMEGHDDRKTEVCRKTLTPVWNEVFKFPVTEAQLNAPLLFEVWDWDNYTPDDHIGDVKFEFASALLCKESNDEYEVTRKNKSRGKLRIRTHFEATNAYDPSSLKK
jgi:hypothetical protein